jgi:hypothetical protein
VVQPLWQRRDEADLGALQIAAEPTRAHLTEAEAALRAGDGSRAEAAYLRTLGKLGPFSDPAWQSDPASDQRTRSHCHARLAALAFDQRDYERSLRETAAAAGARHEAIAIGGFSHDDMRFMITALVHATTVYARVGAHDQAVRSCEVVLDFADYAQAQRCDRRTRRSVESARRAAKRMLEELRRPPVHDGAAAHDAAPPLEVAATDLREIEGEVVIDLTEPDVVIDLTDPPEAFVSGEVDGEALPVVSRLERPADRRQSDQRVEPATTLLAQARTHALMARFLATQEDGSASIHAHRAVRTATRARPWARHDEQVTIEVAATLIDALVTRSDVMALAGNDEMTQTDLRRARTVAEHLWRACPSAASAAAAVLVATRSAARDWDSEDESAIAAHLEQATMIIGDAEALGVKLPDALVMFEPPEDAISERAALMAFGDQLFEVLGARNLDPVLVD